MLNIDIHNKISSDAYVTGLVSDNGNYVCLIKSDAKTPYYPPSSNHACACLSENCPISLRPKVSITTITIPQLAGGRIWFSIGKELIFLVKPGPASVELSVNNPSDCNIHTEWTFCEFAFPNGLLYANISYVGFVSLPVSLSMTPGDGEVRSVLGLKAVKLYAIYAGLEEQSRLDARILSFLYEVWKKYGTCNLIVDTRTQWGSLPTFATTLSNLKE